MALNEQTRERFRRILAIGALVGLILLLYAVFHPFIAALAWAVILAVSFWPLHRRLRSRLTRPEGLAPLLTTVLISLLIMVPIVGMTAAAASETTDLVVQLQALLEGDSQELGELIRDLPLVGEFLEERLAALQGSAGDRSVLSVVLEQIQPMLLDFSRRAAAALSRSVFKLLACLFAIYFLLRHGVALADQLNRGVRELGGERLVELVEEIRLTVRAVVYGLVMTAIVQAVLAAFGFWLADVPYPLLLGSLLLVASFIPFGPPFIWLPAAVAVFARGDIGWGIFLLIWGMAVISSMDNVLRPLFIGQATRMPVLLVFIAVLGGIISFGMVGLFVGPVVMAVALALWRDWIGRRDEDVPGFSLATAGPDPVKDVKPE